MVYSTKRFVLCLTLCYFVLVFLSPFSIAITSLGEERANLSALRTFVRFMLVLVLSVFSSFKCLGRAAVCDCCTPWTFLLPVFFKLGRKHRGVCTSKITKLVPIGNPRLPPWSPYYNLFLASSPELN